MKPEYKYGLITGAVVCLWTLAEFMLGFHTTHSSLGEYSGYFSAVIPLITLTLLLRSLQATQGPLTLRRGLGAGLLASFIAALLVYSFLLIYNHFIDPGWIDVALDGKVGLLRARGVSEVAIRQEIVSFRRMNGPLGLAVAILGGMPLMGGSFSVIITLVLRRKVPGA